MLRNFRFVETNTLAGSNRPESPEEIDWVYSLGIRAIISLAQVNPSVKEAIDRLGIDHLVLLVEDYKTPTSEQVEQFLAFVTKSLAEGKPTMVHCWAGRGRTGTMLAIWFVSQRIPILEAIARAGDIERDRQKAAIFRFHKQRSAPT
ncbi:MAG: protein-tyrosine phosphatase family protein [Candidatus Berkelbacteria bacterium]|nr:protein-tyrosine phosphatase family protein [Candidatus Berkelbacteria bacterium]